MARIVAVAQVREVGKQLLGHELALVDQDLGGEAADVKHLGLLHFRASQQTAGSFANHVELALEGITLQILPGPDKELLDGRFRSPGRRTDVGPLGVGGNASPSQNLLSLLRDKVLYNGLALVPLFVVGGQKHHSGRELAGRR